MKKIVIKNMDGTMEEVTEVRSFGINEIQRNFIIMSKGEEVDGMSKIYVSEIAEENGVYKLLGIENDDVWMKVKEAMKHIIEEAGNNGN